ncbi:MAG: hypothetical protein E7321_00250 [Clostridiales bacterium]|nr:hypothetical protein [Clostridiales bacterium]
MTADQIIRHAMLELDEDPGDMSEYDQRFRMYMNTGYQLILRQYYKPRETFVCHADENGRVNLDGFDIERVVEMRDKTGRCVPFGVCPDGCGMHQTAVRNQDVTVICQVNYPALESGLDVPRIPEHVHDALVSYICYKHLSGGNLAKQSRAQVYLQSFYEAMRMLRPMGAGSVTAYKNLYSATNI